ncbi:hypothetical protein B0T24DRAFT_629398 [Lasiosphaeria ovina]|uniref:DUF726-domain-containing protein n=1 Tax=Lasiosphaeria ovina TaxID=92902 RepID=A0AAE0K8U2_9PEZI|nr:hypothetical protein B0T24DRAFT_629398 [Lasiosphaeria ovina]
MTAPKIQIQQAVENDQLLTQLYPPTQTTLGSLTLEKRNLLLHSLLLLLLSLEHYSSYSRILLLNIASSLNLPLRMLTEGEVRVAKALAQVVKDIQQGDLTHKKKTTDDGKSSKKWKNNMADSGALIGPLVAASIGQAVGGGLGTSTTASVLGPLANNKLAVAAFFGLGRTVGKGMEQYAKDIPDLAFVPLHGSLGNQPEICKINPENRRFRVVFCINGWVNNEKPAGVSGATRPWKALEDHNEVHMLRWELETLGKIGNALEVVMKSTAWSKAKKEIIARTSEQSSILHDPACVKPTNTLGPVFASLHQAIWPAGLLNVCKVIDNPWCIGLSRADKTGSVLADIIISKGQGERGVTLVGYSLGARVIFTCLMALAERRAFGLVENAVLMGAPMPSDEFSWCAMKSVVSGRLINVFSENDHLLGFMYRMSSLHAGVAGLQRIQGVDGVENVDASANVSTHWRYQYMVGSILKHIGWENIDHAQVAKDEEVLAMVDRENVERERNHDADLAKKSGYGAENEVQQEPIPTRKRKNKNKNKNKKKK